MIHGDAFTVGAWQTVASRPDLKANVLAFVKPHDGKATRDTTMHLHRGKAKSLHKVDSSWRGIGVASVPLQCPSSISAHYMLPHKPLTGEPKPVNSELKPLNGEPMPLNAHPKRCNAMPKPSNVNRGL